MAGKEISIPDEDLNTFKTIITLPEAEFRNFIDVLDSVENITDESGFNTISQELTKIDKKYEVIISLIYTFCKFDISSSFFIEELYKMLKEKFDDEILEDLTKARISKIIKDENRLKLILKAKILQRENDRLYLDARIISDIRPIFSSKEEEVLIGQTLIHTLKIAYKESDKRLETFFALDEEDLIQMRELIERAIRKHNLLKTVNLKSYGK